MLVPLMKKYNVSAYFQGHRHTLEHSQEHGYTKEDDVHYFTVGAGALMDGEGIYWELIDDVPPEWPCDKEDKSNGVSYCHFGWYTKGSDGGYATVNINRDHATISLIGSTDDTLVYQKQLKSRKATGPMNL